jgi:CheY-like chemotaxis protein
MMYQDLSILYVEDDPRSRRVMQMMLVNSMKLPYVVMFEDSEDFLERVQMLDPQPNIVFLDVHVKPYTGFEMLEMLRELEQFAHVPVVALTASVMNEEIYQLKEAGFNGCVAKPIDTDTFPEILSLIAQGEEVWRIVG